MDVDGIATSNPFRYRGYYWDSYLNLYYLISRYYDPATSRFINTDSLEYLDPESIHGLNLFAYCICNPIMGVDPSGHSVVLVLILAGTFALGFGSSLLVNAATNNWELDWRDFVQAGIDGIFAIGSTLLAMTGIGFWLSVAVGAAMGWGQYALGSAVQGKELTLSGSLTAFAFGAIGGAISGAGARNTHNIASNLNLTGKGASAVKAIATASSRYSMGEISLKGLKGTVQLWGDIAFDAVQTAMPKTIERLFMQSAVKLAIYTPLANLASGGLNYGYETWGWI